MTVHYQRLLHSTSWRYIFALIILLAIARALAAQAPEPVAVEGQPLANNVKRLLEALESLGAPFHQEKKDAFEAAIKERDAAKLQKLLDRHVSVVVSLSPEARVKAKRGPGYVRLQQAGYTPLIIKVLNESTVTKPLRISSPQARPIFSGGGAGNKGKPTNNYFLEVQMYTKQPMTDKLSGLEVEYAIALIHSSEAGQPPVGVRFDDVQGHQ